MKAIGIILAGGNNSRMQELSNRERLQQCLLGAAIEALILHSAI